MDNTRPPVVGIDLGTSESRMAVCRDGKVEIIPNYYAEGKLFTLSYVTFIGKKTYVGEYAKRQLQTGTNLMNIVFDVKRLIGRSDHGSLPPTDQFYWPFEVSVSGGKAHIQVEKNGAPREYYPERILSYVLKRMLKNAHEFLDHQVTQAVMTVPTYFNEAQRQQATIDIAEIAKINVLHVIDNCMAAALAYCCEKNLKDAGLVLVYELGKYVLQVSVLDVQNFDPKIVATDFDKNLGSSDIDLCLLSYCLSAIWRCHKIDLRNDFEAQWKLLLACEEAKKTLSERYEATIRVDCLCNDFSFTRKISRQKFEGLYTGFIKDTLNIVESTLEKARIKKFHINHVILVGGSTRIPKLREMVRDHFEREELDQCVDPQEAVVYGAAIAGALLNESIQQESTVEGIRPIHINKPKEVRFAQSETVTSNGVTQKCMKSAQGSKPKIKREDSSGSQNGFHNHNSVKSTRRKEKQSFDYSMSYDDLTTRSGHIPEQKVKQRPKRVASYEHIRDKGNDMHQYRFSGPVLNEPTQNDVISDTRKLKRNRSKVTNFDKITEQGNEHHVEELSPGRSSQDEEVDLTFDMTYTRGIVSIFKEKSIPKYIRCENMGRKCAIMSMPFQGRSIEKVIYSNNSNHHREVIVSVDANGITDVSDYTKIVTGQRNFIVAGNNQADEQKETELSVMKEELKELRRNELIRRERDLAKTDLENFVYELKNVVADTWEGKISEDEEEWLENACYQMLDIIDEIGPAEKNTYEVLLRDFKTRIQPLIYKLMY